MPFRQRAKALFKPKTRSDSTSKSSSTNSDRERYPSNVYRPDEPMPKPKYRLPPKKEHTEKLEAFSFASSWRKRSFNSTYSPMGTRAPSRRNSWLGRREDGLGQHSRAGSFGAATGDALPPRTRDGHHVHMSTQAEQEGDDDVANGALRDDTVPLPLSWMVGSMVVSNELTVGLSRAHSHRRTARDVRSSGMAAASVTAHDHEPFSEHELSLALQRSNIAVSAEA